MPLLRAYLDLPGLRPTAAPIRARRGLALFVLQTGGCDGCAMEVDALRSGAFDLGRHRIRIVDAPEAAELLLICGSLTHAMRPWLEHCWAQMHRPKGIAAIGDCAMGQGPFPPNYATADTGGPGLFAGLQRCDMTLRGCPPLPQDILRGLLLLASGQIVTA